MRAIIARWIREGKTVAVGRLHEFLNVKEFITLHDAWEKLKAWQDD
ncbi:hypothetical protein [Methyloversatilis discipulorum]